MRTLYYDKKCLQFFHIEKNKNKKFLNTNMLRSQVWILFETIYFFQVLSPFTFGIKEAIIKKYSIISSLKYLIEK